MLFSIFDLCQRSGYFLRNAILGMFYANPSPMQHLLNDEWIAYRGVPAFVCKTYDYRRSTSTNTWFGFDLGKHFIVKRYYLARINKSPKTLAETI